jgi:hypothetical protein
MGFWDFLVPAELPYPGMPAGNGRTQGGAPSTGTPTSAQPGQPAQTGAQGFLDKIFVPADLPYPQPVDGRAATVTAPTTAATALQAAPAFGCTPAPAQSTAQTVTSAQQAVATVAAPSAPLASTVAPAATSAAVAPSSAAAPALAAASAPAPAAVTAAPAASSPAPSPVTVVIAPWPLANGQQAAPASGANGAAPSSAAASSSAASAPSSPAVAAVAPATNAPAVAQAPAATPQLTAESLTLPVGDSAERSITAYCRNPRLRSRPPKAHEVYIEEVLDEVITTRMLSKEAPPVAFAVPDGCNAVQLSIGPIEVDTEHGSADDLNEVVTVGELKIEGVDENGLTTGEQVTVTAPWRYASFVELAADHLRFPIFARFFQKQLTQ